MSASTHSAVPFEAEAHLHGGGPGAGPQPRSTSRRIFSGTLVRGAGELLAKAASVAFYIAIARKLGEQSFGDFIFGLSLSTLLFTAAGFGTDDLVAREVAKDRRSLEGLFANVLVLKTVIIAVMLGVIALVVTVQGYSPDTKLAIMLISVGVGLEIISKTLQAVFQAYERMQYIAATLIIQRALVAAVGIAALFAGGNLVTACAIFAAGGIVANVSAWFWLHRAVVRPRLEIDTSRWVAILRAGAPLGFVGAVYYALIKVDATLLSFLNGGNNAQVGHYGAAFRLIEATMFVSWAFGGAMFPWLSRRVDGDGGVVSLVRGYELGLKALVAMLLPIGTFFAIYARPLIELLYGSNFGDAIVPLRFLAAMTVLYGVNAFIAMLMIARGRPSEFTRPALLVVAQNVIFNLILIPPLGATGAAINAVVSGILLAGLTLRAAQRIFGEISIARVLVAPAAASVAMLAVALATGISLTAAGAIGGAAAYLVTLLALERYVFPDDWGFYASVLRLRRASSSAPPVRPVSALPGMTASEIAPPAPPDPSALLQQRLQRSGQMRAGSGLESNPSNGRGEPPMPLIRRSQPETDPAQGPEVAAVPSTPGITRSAADATGRIQQIIDAAERAAAEIRADAAADAEGYAAQLRLDAENLAAERRHESEQLAAQQAQVLAEIADTLSAKVSLLEVQLGGVVSALHEAIGRLQSGSAVAPESPAPSPAPQPAPVYSYGEAARGSAGPTFEPAPAASPAPAPAPAVAPEPTVADTAVRPLPAPSGPPSQEQREAALLRATQMAVAGSGREDISDTLIDEFGIADPAPILDQVLGASG